ncbi:Methylenetetrahydrofolate dehydrogenase [NAD(+)] [Lachnellula cervina]|uniref:Methylenetetrahydrofolate dehydrogenase [NAD(+)] n=1 Tax=Lachnellula cervina TaxID=1316786 RepID=A0A7D8UL44_9HELO|nr:Methylenetetrahydrofolate dehydrogenase [NAD(+)] [Lachnellula cervina]
MASKEPAHNCKVFLAGTIARGLLAEVAEGLSKLDTKPRLVGFLANDDPAARMYADWSAKTCIENGFDFDLRIVGKEEIEERILAANTDSTVHGIIVYYPIFPRPSGQDRYIQQIVALEKDVEGLSHRYVFNMYQNIRFLDPPTNTLKSILPCTPLAVVKVLEYLQIYNSILPYGNRLFGKTITVINRSEVVGRPLAALLANDGAKVFSVDLDGVQIFTRGQGIKKSHHEVQVQDESFTIRDCLPVSDVVISGVPGDKYKVDLSLVRDGAVCVNFSSEKNFDSPAVKEKASIYIPAIGKVTIAVLLRNLLRLVQNQSAGKKIVGGPEALNGSVNN